MHASVRPGELAFSPSWAQKFCCRVLHATTAADGDAAHFLAHARSRAVAYLGHVHKLSPSRVTV